MELAAIFITPDEKDFASFPPHPAPHVQGSRPFYSALLPILGNDVRRMWTDRLHKLGVQSFWLGSAPENDKKAFSQLCRLAKEGVEHLLMIKLKFYAEMDLVDLLRFHSQSRKPMTEVHDSRGKLGVSVLDRPLVLAATRKGESFRFQTDFEPVMYPFKGYSKRILSSKERQELVGDALAGSCALQPLGKEIREGVWLGDGVNLASSAQVLGPAYIGNRTIVRAGATIGPFASVERDCVVDCGTTLERSTVLPETYLAPGLLIRNGLVDGGQMEDICSRTVVDLQLSGLARRMPAHEFTAGVAKSASTAANHPWFTTSSSSGWQNAQL